MIFSGFTGLFDHLRNSQEKTIIRGGNCLTALKTANIMPDGRRDFLLATRFDSRAVRSTVGVVLVVVRFFETLGGACGAGRRSDNEGHSIAR